MRLIYLLLIAAPLFSQTVDAYWELTAAQNDAILRNEDIFSTWLRSKYDRLTTVANELSAERAKDPIALGVRYAETEAIRRKIADRRAATGAANEQLLTSAQSSRLRTLEEAPCIPASADYPVSRAIVVGGNATPSDLGLSSEQRAAYQTITGEFDRWCSSQQEAISRWRSAACMAAAASPLDPAAIGTPEAYIAVAERQIALRRAARVKAHQELLPPDPCAP